MEQQAAFDFAHTRARQTDPQTSRDAAASMMVGAKAQREACYWALLRAGIPLNADEIAMRTGLTMEQVCRRLPEMARPEDGRIEKTDIKRPTRRGRDATCWRLRPTWSEGEGSA